MSKEYITSNRWVQFPATCNLLSNNGLKDFESNACNHFRIYFVSQLVLRIGKFFKAQETTDLWNNFKSYQQKNKLVLDSKINLIESLTITELGKIGITKSMISEWKEVNKTRHVNYNVVSQSSSLV